MPGMRRLSGSGVGQYGNPAGDVGVARNGDLIEIVTEQDASVIEIVEPIAGAGGGGATDIDVTDPAQSPISVPVALVRGPDGIVRADAGDAFAMRPTRDEVTAQIGVAFGRLGARHVQEIPAQTWLIFHDLPFIPAGVAVEGEQGQRIWPLEVAHPAIGRTRIEFTRPVAGAVDLS